MAAGETLIGTPDGPYEGDPARQAGDDFREFFAYPQSFDAEPTARNAEREYSEHPYFSDPEEDHPREQGDPNV